MHNRLGTPSGWTVVSTAATLTMVTWGLSAGCQSSSKPVTPRGGSSAIATRPAVTADATRTDDLDTTYLIGPTAARALNYRIDWQINVLPQNNSGVKSVSAQYDSIFVLDGENFLTRVRREDGTVMWRIPVADATSKVYGVTYLSAVEQIYLLSGGLAFVHDAATGSQLQRQRLGSVANTAPSVFGRFLIYGARNGQLVWHSYDIGYQWKSYQISAAIGIPPVVFGDSVLAIGTDGKLLTLDAASVAGIWSEQLLDSVVATPVVGHGLVYVAGLDQYVWAFDASNGRRVWRYLSDSPLENSPVLIGDALFQQIPSEGLVSFVADPLDSPRGKVNWRAGGIRGNVLVSHGDRLFVWDEASGRLMMLDAMQGASIDTINLSKVRHLSVSSRESGNIIAAGDDGRLIRLLPKG